MMKIYKLYEINDKGNRVLVFHSVEHRRRFLLRKRSEAIKARQQISYRGTEYLRIYNNCKLYAEYDIHQRRNSENAKQQAERFFKHG